MQERLGVSSYFPAMTRMAGMTVRAIGIERTRVWSPLKALSYNLNRLEVLNLLRKIPIDWIGVGA